MATFLEGERSRFPRLNAIRKMMGVPPVEESIWLHAVEADLDHGSAAASTVSHIPEM
jgi:hypothetical protein